MRENGFTLVEMVTVIAIIGILTAMATLGFRAMTQKSQIEGETKEICADLMTVRSQALFRKRARAVGFTNTQFSIYSSGVTSVPPISTKTLKQPITYSSANVTFDPSGVADPAVFICVGQSGKAGDADSIIISTTSLMPGIRTGGSCDNAGISAK